MELSGLPLAWCQWYFVDCFVNNNIPSLSAIKTVAVEGKPTLTLALAAVRETLKDSVPSQRLSSTMGMLQHSWLSVPENTRGLQVMGP